MFPVDQRNTEFIRLLRSSGWHQARAARELGLTTGAVSRYISGEIKPSLPVLRLMADRIQEPLLLPGEEGNPAEWRDGGPKFLESWEAGIIAELRRLERPAREKVIGALRDIIDAVAKPVRYTTPRKKEETPDPSGFPHAGDEERVLGALQELVQVGREEEERIERKKLQDAFRAAKSSVSKSRRRDRDPTQSKPQQSEQGNRA